MLRKIQAAAEGAGTGKRWADVNSEWRRRTNEIPTRHSLVLRAMKELRNGGEASAFLKLVSDKRVLVQDYVRDFLLLREKLARTRDEAEKKATDCYNKYVIRELRDNLPGWNQQMRFHRALAVWVHNAFADFCNGRKIPDPDEYWDKSCGQDALREAWRRLEDAERAQPDNRDYTLLRLEEQHPEADGRELVRLFGDVTDVYLREATLRKRLSRARERFAQLLYEKVRAENPAAGPGELVETIEDLGLMAYFSKSFLEENFGLT